MKICLFKLWLKERSQSIYYKETRYDSQVFKTRSVPYGLRKKFEEGILRLVEKDNLEPVKKTDIVPSIVPVLKQIGQIRI